MKKNAATHFFIPDLCTMSSILFLVIMTELVALLMALVNSEQGLLDWYYLGILSLFGIWVTLTCAAALCILRRPLSRFPVATAAALGMALIITITLVYSLVALNLFEPVFGNSRLTSPEALEFYLRNTLIATIIGGMTLRYFYLQFQWQQQKQAEVNARLEALQARIRPHFLFNSMNTIASLISIDPEKAEEAVLDLSTLFRATLNTQQLLVPLADELSLCRHYLHIESLRLGDRMQVQWRLDPAADQARIPPLTLQPLVENAIYHGIQPRLQGGEISIETRLENQHIYILISNPFDQPASTDHRHQGNRIALSNIRHRLESLFQQRAVFKTSYHNGIYTVTIRLPMIDAAQSPTVPNPKVPKPTELKAKEPKP